MGGGRGEGERARPGEMKSRPAEERKRERCREMDSGGRGEREPNKERRECASVKSESERRDGGRAAGTRGVNDARIVQSRTQTPVEFTYVSASGPAHSGREGEKAALAHAAAVRPASPRQPAAGAGADPSPASQTFEILAAASARRHCVSL